MTIRQPEYGDNSQNLPDRRIIHADDEGATLPEILGQSYSVDQTGPERFHPTEAQLRKSEKELEVRLRIADRAIKNPKTWWD